MNACTRALTSSYTGAGVGSNTTSAWRAAPDAGRVKVRFEGAPAHTPRRDGALVLLTRAGEVRQDPAGRLPAEGNMKTFVACDYTLSKSGEVGFRLGAYDRAREMVIDPCSSIRPTSAARPTRSRASRQTRRATPTSQAPTEATPSSSSQPNGHGARLLDPHREVGADVGLDIALDAAATPTSPARPAPRTSPPRSDAFDKTAATTALCDERGRERSRTPSSSSSTRKAPRSSTRPISAARASSRYRRRSTGPPTRAMGVPWTRAATPLSRARPPRGLPTTAGALPHDAGTSYVMKLNPRGPALVYSTYFPGAIAQSIALDAAGNAHITGMTTTTDSDPPTLPVVNAYQPTSRRPFTFDAFAAKLNPTGTALVSPTSSAARRAQATARAAATTTATTWPLTRPGTSTSRARRARGASPRSTLTSRGRTARAA